MSTIQKKDIAVIGMSCRFSDSDDPAAFWQNLCEGKELLHILETTAGSMAAADNGNERYIKTESIIRDKESFDFSFFGYTRAEAAVMDPQVRLFHEFTWKALEDAGYDPFRYGGKIGVFAGASDNTNWLLHATMAGMDSDVDPYFRSIISNRNFLSTLLCYKLNLKGPGYFINSACSTSLSAIHIACRNLLMRECDMALAGAVRIHSVNTTGYKYQPGMIYSKDGHCRAFDEDASGTVGGDGVGIVVLKRLSEAVKDGDRIYAIIKGSAVNNDGNRKVGFTGPSVAGQAECIKMAHKMAEVDPASVSYVETHGTATRLGDPVEIEALNQAFGNNGKKYCAIGAVKSNVGHLDTAAGIVAFIKTVLALYYKELPPCINYNTANPEINFEDGPFYVNTVLKKWEREEGRPLRAGVSSFGIGGTNVHIVLEEAPAPPPASAFSGYQLLLCSARSKAALQRQVLALTGFIGQSTENIADVAYTLQCRRRHFKYREYIVCQSEGGVIKNILARQAGEVEQGKEPVVVFMFPGQGAQYCNMMLGLYQQELFFKHHIDEGLRAIEEMTGISMRDIVFNSNKEAAETINNTLYAQPLLFIFEYALAKWVIQMGIQPSYTIGHSLGELVAACVSGIFSFEDGLRLAGERGRMMSEMPGGAMLGVELPAGAILPLLEDDLSLAAVNTPSRCVVSGTYAGIAALAEKLSSSGISCRKLMTSHAFHSSIIAPVQKPLSEIVAAINMSLPAIPLVSNLTGKIAGEDILTPGYWANQLRKPVLFAEGIEQLMQLNRPVIFLEIGPGNTLSGFCRQISNNRLAGNSILNLVKHPLETTDDSQVLADRLGACWLKGLPVNWQAWYSTQTRNVVSLPPYSFDRNILPADVDAIESITKLILKDSISRKKENISEWFYVPGWKRTILLEDDPDNGAHIINYILFSDGSTWSARLKEFLLRKGHSVTEINKNNCFAQPSVQAGYKQLTEMIAANGYDRFQVIYTWSLPDAAAEAACITDTCYTGSFFDLLSWLNAMSGAEPAVLTKLFVITHLLQPVLHPEEPVYPGAATLPGLLKVAAQENPQLFCCNIDIAISEDPQLTIPGIYEESLHNSVHPLVALRNGHRYTEVYEQVHLQGIGNNRFVRTNGTYLITGGLGKAGVCLAGHLLANYNANVVLIGKTTIPENNGIPATELSDPALLNRLTSLARLQQLPGRVSYYAVDVADQLAFSAFVDELEDRFGKIDGIIHAAGHIDHKDFKALEWMGKEDVTRHFRPKIQGLINIWEVFKNRLPDFVWITSSISVVLGGLTYGAYVAANTFMSYFIKSRQPTLKNWICVELDSLSLKDDHAEEAIGRSELVQVFEQSFRLAAYSRVIISVSALEPRIDKYVRKINSPAIAPRLQMPVQPRTHHDEPPVSGEQGNLSATEEIMFLIWKDFFGLESLHINDNFFELGGDSLKAMTLSKRMYKAFGVDIPIKFFFTNASIRLLAREIEVALQLKTVRAGGDAGEGTKELIV